MAIDQSKSRRKVSSGRYHDHRKKRKSDMGNVATHTKVGATKKRTDRVLGGNEKIRFLHADVANVINQKTKKAVKAKINSVIESPANRHYVRRNIITKGTIIETDKGKAKVTSRPGQEATINAVLIE